MATISNLSKELIGSKTPKLYNRIRTTIESVFYGNNVIPVKTMKEAYELAKRARHHRNRYAGGKGGGTRLAGRRQGLVI